MEQIYLKIKKIIYELSDRYGYEIEKTFTNSKKLTIKIREKKSKKK